MPKLGLKLGAEAAKVVSTEGFANYTGPTPPPGVYPAVVKQIGVQESKESKKTMLRVIIEFKAPEGDPRKKYNGYSIFHYLVIPDSKTEEYYGLQVGQVNRMLDALSDSDENVKKVFWGDGADTDAAGKKVTKIGRLDCTKREGIEILVSAKTESFNRKMLDDKKRPIKVGGKEQYESVTSLRVNDLFPKGDERGLLLSDEQEDQAEKDEATVSEGIIDESDAVVADANGGLDDPSDDDSDGWDDGVAAEEPAADTEDAATEEAAEPEPEAEVDDSAELIAQEVPDETPVTEEPKPAERKRRSAF